MTSFVKMPLDYKKDGDQADGVRMYEERQSNFVYFLFKKVVAIFFQAPLFDKANPPRMNAYGFYKRNFFTK